MNNRELKEHIATINYAFIDNMKNDNSVSINDVFNAVNIDNYEFMDYITQLKQFGYIKQNDLDNFTVLQKLIDWCE